VIDLDTLVNGAITGVFGEALAYTAKASQITTTIQAPFSDPYKQQVLMEDGTAAWREESPYFGCRLSDLPSLPVRGDTVVRVSTGVRYLVFDSVPDGVGWTRILLKVLS
jgi:hypothetical protein